MLGALAGQLETKWVCLAPGMPWVLAVAVVGISQGGPGHTVEALQAS